MLIQTTTPSGATHPGWEIPGEPSKVTKERRREGRNEEGKKGGRGERRRGTPLCQRTFLISQYIHKQGGNSNPVQSHSFLPVSLLLLLRMPEVNEPKYKEGLPRLTVEISGYNQLAVTIRAYALWQE